MKTEKPLLFKLALLLLGLDVLLVFITTNYLGEALGIVIFFLILTLSYYLAHRSGVEW